MRKCNQMPYHIGLVLKLHLSRQGKHIVAVNDGASRAVYNRLVVSGNEKYRLRKTADLVPMDRARLDFLKTSYQTEAGIKNAMPFLYEKDVDCQVVTNSIRNYRAAWKIVSETLCAVMAVRTSIRITTFSTTVIRSYATLRRCSDTLHRMFFTGQFFHYPKNH